MNRKGVIIGAGGHATSVAETVLASGYVLSAFISEHDAAETLLGYPILSSIPEGHFNEGGIAFVAIGDNWSRAAVWDRLLAAFPLDGFPSIIHPSASVSRFATINHGSVVLQGAVVASGAQVGTGCILNSGSILEHECVMHDFASVAPGASVGGRVKIGERSAVSIGASIRHGVTIGEDTVIGAASYVHGDVPDHVVAFGRPATIVRSRAANDPYLT